MRVGPRVTGCVWPRKQRANYFSSQFIFLFSPYNKVVGEIITSTTGVHTQTPMYRL